MIGAASFMPKIKLRRPMAALAPPRKRAPRLLVTALTPATSMPRAARARRDANRNNYDALRTRSTRGTVIFTHTICTHTTSTCRKVRSPYQRAPRRPSGCLRRRSSHGEPARRRRSPAAACTPSVVPRRPRRRGGSGADRRGSGSRIEVWRRRERCRRDSRVQPASRSVERPKCVCGIHLASSATPGRRSRGLSARESSRSAVMSAAHTRVSQSVPTPDAVNRLPSSRRVERYCATVSEARTSDRYVTSASRTCLPLNVNVRRFLLLPSIRAFSVSVAERTYVERTSSSIRAIVARSASDVSSPDEGSSDSV